MTETASTSPADADDRSRQQRGNARRQAILDAAVELFAARGYQGTGVAALADEVGMTAPGLLYYFGTKDDLVGAILDRRMPAVMARRVELLEAIDAAPSPPTTIDVVSAFALPMAELIETVGAPGRSYARFVSRLVHDRSPALERMAMGRHEPGLRLLDSLLVRANPSLPATVVRARIDLALRAVFDVLADLPPSPLEGAPEPGCCAGSCSVNATSHAGQVGE